MNLVYNTNKPSTYVITRSYRKNHNPTIILVNVKTVNIPYGQTNEH
jgi:hypothetical protein